MEAQIRFVVANQQIKRIDDFKPVAKSRNYLLAHFDFTTEEWQNTLRTVIFRVEGRRYTMILNDQDECEVPWEVLQNGGSYVYVSCFANGESLITANEVSIFVGATGYTDESEPSRDPTPGVYAQILDKLEDMQEAIDSKTTSMDGGSFTDWR